MAVLDECVERAHRFFDRRGRIEAVNLVQVDVIELQALEARLDAVHDVVARGTARVGGFRRRAEHLGGNHHLVTRHLQVFKREAGDLLGQALRVDIGGVDEIDARIDRAANETLGIGLLQIADLPPDAFAAAKRHGAETEFRNKQAGAA
jgi:hypothetical protein